MEKHGINNSYFYNTPSIWKTDNENKRKLKSYPLWPFPELQGEPFCAYHVATEKISSTNLHQTLITPSTKIL